MKTQRMKNGGRAELPLRLPRRPAKRQLCPTSFVRLLAICQLLTAIAFSAHAQSYSVDWHKIAGGGGTSTNSQYSLIGTIGQPDASVAMSSGQYSVSGGYWVLINVVQTAGLPNLVIAYSGSGVTVSWPNTGSYTLQQSADIGAVNGWTTTGYPISTASGTNSITLTSPTGNLFFRLRQ